MGTFTLDGQCFGDYTLVQTFTLDGRCFGGYALIGAFTLDGRSKVKIKYSLPPDILFFIYAFLSREDNNPRRVN